MALTLNDQGYLPPGVHDASLQEVEQLFARFQRTDRRITLFGKLAAYLREVKRAGCGVAVVLDGSFVIACVDEPEDIDLVLILPRTGT